MVLQRTVRHSGRISNPLIDSKFEFTFGDTLVGSSRMVEFMLPTPGSTPYIPVILDVVHVKIPSLLGLYVPDGNNLIVCNVTYHL